MYMKSALSLLLAAAFANGVNGQAVPSGPDFAGGNSSTSVGTVFDPATVVQIPLKDNTFQTMFPQLDSFDTFNNVSTARFFMRSIAALMTFDDPNDGGEQQNPLISAGHTYLGQFIDHDMTFDNNSRLMPPSIAPLQNNSRNPFLDLDSIYGLNGKTQPDPQFVTSGMWRRDSNGRWKFNIRKYDVTGLTPTVAGGADVDRYDLPRDSKGNANVPERRNDENKIIMQMTVAFMNFHNHATDWIANGNLGLAPTDVTVLYQRARQALLDHYHWVVVKEHLRLLIGQDVVDDIISGSGVKFFKPVTGNNGTKLFLMPWEFSVAAYRFGHSQVRQGYAVNNRHFVFPTFDSTFDGTIGATDLRGGAYQAPGDNSPPTPPPWIDWSFFFEGITSGFPQANRKIDTDIANTLHNLPGFNKDLPGQPRANDATRSLPARNLMRHVNVGLASGQDIARAMGLTPLPASTIFNTTNTFVRAAGFSNKREKLVQLIGEAQTQRYENSTPLFYYCLREAEVQKDGNMLGEVCGRIVGEVILGLMINDNQCFLSSVGQVASNNPNGRLPPYLPSKTAGDFTMGDFMIFARQASAF
ncbi:hypothetical protein HDV00_009227 [Rhizophlyctis rosea]|nr:hypothetical protein HDV00_009227 [Rhizophlyctis rosea]